LIAIAEIASLSCVAILRAIEVFGVVDIVGLVVELGKESGGTHDAIVTSRGNVNTLVQVVVLWVVE